MGIDVCILYLSMCDLLHACMHGYTEARSFVYVHAFIQIHTYVYTRTYQKSVLIEVNVPDIVNTDFILDKVGTKGQ